MYPGLKAHLKTAGTQAICMWVMQLVYLHFWAIPEMGVGKSFPNIKIFFKEIYIYTLIIKKVGF